MANEWIGVLGTLAGGLLGIVASWLAMSESKAARRERLRGQRRQELVAVYTATLHLTKPQDLFQPPQDLSEEGRRRDAERWRDHAVALTLLGSDSVRAAFTEVQGLDESFVTTLLSVRDRGVVPPPDLDDFPQKRDAAYNQLVAAIRTEMARLDAER